jgi:hypothetical protein
MTSTADWATKAAEGCARYIGRDDKHLVDNRDLMAEFTSIIAVRAPRCETCAWWTTATQECAALRTGPLNVIYTAPDFRCVKHKER